MSKSVEHGLNKKAGPQSTSPKADASAVRLSIDRDCLRQLVAEIVATLPHLDWPAGRVALTEAEAAAACGVCRHVLRDLRLSGQLVARKLGRRVLYTRADLLAALEVAAL